MAIKDYTITTNTFDTDSTFSLPYDNYGSTAYTITTTDTCGDIVLNGNTIYGTSATGGDITFYPGSGSSGNFTLDTQGYLYISLKDTITNYIKAALASEGLTKEELLAMYDMALVEQVMDE